MPRRQQSLPGDNLFNREDSASASPSVTSDRISAEKIALPNSKDITLTSVKGCYQWLQSMLGLVTLALTLVSILMYSIRSQRLAVWKARNDVFQSWVDTGFWWALISTSK